MGRARPQDGIEQGDGVALAQPHDEDTGYAQGSERARRRRINWNLLSLGEDAGMVEDVLFGSASLIQRGYKSRAVWSSCKLYSVGLV